MANEVELIESLNESCKGPDCEEQDCSHNNRAFPTLEQEVDSNETNCVNVMAGYEEPKTPEGEELHDSDEQQIEDSIEENVKVKKRLKFILGDPPLYFCTICKRSFKLKRQSRYHDYCLTGKRPLKCKLCDKRFIKNFHLEYHIRTHTGEAPFKCSFCGKGFKQKDKVKRHESIHTGKGINVTELTCTICGKVLSGKQALKNHMLTHSAIKPFRCKHCEKRFSNKNYFNKHVKKHTSGPSYVCEVCGKYFKSISNLNCHTLSHTGDRPHKCEKCKAAFRSKQGLERHYIKHNGGEADFECLVCSATFGRKDNMVRHLKNNHGRTSGEPKCNRLNNEISSNVQNPQTLTNTLPNIRYVHKSVIMPAKPSTETIREPVIKHAP